MSDLKTQLLRLGHKKPELRPHLREVLARLSKEAARVQVSQDVRNQYAELDRLRAELDLLLDRFGQASLDSKYNRRIAGNLIIVLANLLFKGLTNHILEDLEIPSKDLKKIERALQTVQKIRRVPNKPGTWWTKNRRHIEVLYNTRAYLTRDDEDSNLTFDLRGFTVYNTIQAEGQEMDEIRDLIERSVDAMKRSNVPVVPKLLYGKLKIVGKIQQSKTLAWYNIKNDDMSVRTRIASHLDAAHSIIHELGHRWWNRFLSRDVQARWKTHHRRVGAKESDYPMPDVGDPLGLPVRGVGENPLVVSIRGRAPRREFSLEGGNIFVKESQLRKISSRRTTQPCTRRLISKSISANRSPCTCSGL